MIVTKEGLNIVLFPKTVGWQNAKNPFEVTFSIGKIGKDLLNPPWISPVVVFAQVCGDWRSFALIWLHE